MQKSVLSVLMFIALIAFSVNLYAEDEKAKFKSMDPSFYETSTRFIIIVSCIDAQCKETSIDHVSDNAYYYEINKKTGKSLKLKGRILNNSYSLSFQGYAFTYKDFLYTMNLQSNPSLVITKKKQ